MASEGKFEKGLKETIRWYLINKSFVKKIKKTMKKD